METIHVNVLTTRTRRTRVNGREYVVAPATMIVPGVLNGSMGAMYYPPEEVAKNVDSWNGIPTVVYHPVINGTHVSARRPDVSEFYEVGRVYNTSYDGRLKSEVWFDVEATNRVDSRVMNALTKGSPLELSTGLYTVNEPAPEGSNHNGVPYQYIARNYRPDHLAVLPDQTGACSVTQGCGVLVNTDWDLNPPPITNQPVIPTPSDTAMNRDAVIDFLVTNCDCWKAQGDRDVLKTFSDEKLKSLKDQTDRLKALPVSNVTPSATTIPVPVPVPVPTPTLVPTSTPVSVVTPPATNGIQQPVPVAQPVAPPTFEQWLAMAPAEGARVINHARSVEQQHKQALVGRLVINMLDGADKTAMIQQLSAMSIEQLQSLLALVPAPAPVAGYNPGQVGVVAPVGNFNFGYSAPAPVLPDNDKDDVWLPPTINFAEEAASRRRQH